MPTRGGPISYCLCFGEPLHLALQKQRGHQDHEGLHAEEEQKQGVGGKAGREPALALDADGSAARLLCGLGPEP